MENSKSQHAVFVFLPGGGMGKPEYHLGVSYIRAFLHTNYGVKTTQIVPHLRENATGYIRSIVQSSPTIVGFSVYDNNFLVTSTVSRMVRESLPDIPIVFGGP